MTDVPNRIWLEPLESADPNIGQTWCINKAPGWYDEDGNHLEGHSYTNTDWLREQIEGLYKGPEYSSYNDTWSEAIDAVLNLLNQSEDEKRES